MYITEQLCRTLAAYIAKAIFKPIPKSVTLQHAQSRAQEITAIKGVFLETLTYDYVLMFTFFIVIRAKSGYADYSKNLLCKSFF